MTAALDDIVVLDFSRVLAGPLVTMMLADFGATVTKVERPGVGDDTRGWGPPYAPDGTATYYLSVNRNKRSVTADFGDPADLAALRSLAASADVVVENFRPGVLDAIGLGYADLAVDNPGLVYCSITGFGPGAGAELPGYDLLIQAVGGLMSVTGAPEGGPQKVGVALVDVVAGLFATVGILTALRHRQRTGTGQRVEVDLMTALLAALVNQASATTVAGAVPGRMGNAHPSIAPYELFDARDGQIALAVGTDRQFAALCAVLGADELPADPRFATNDGRVVHRGVLRALLEERLTTDTPSGWAERLMAARVPAGAVNDVASALELAAQLGLEPTVELPRPDGSAVSLVRNPIGLSASPARYVSAPPSLGPRIGAASPAGTEA
jgi:crotonobetainyl-CoA:carnitine CoA-transferase CaiB-like acyl-CoA transferase